VCRAERLQDTVFNIERIEQLLAHEVQIRCRRPAGWRPCIPPMGVLHARIGQRRHQRVGGVQAIFAHMLLPVLRQIGNQFGG
jgi:hypothetical protein